MLEVLERGPDDAPGRAPLHQAGHRDREIDGEVVGDVGALVDVVERVAAVDGAEHVALDQLPRERPGRVTQVVVEHVPDVAPERRGTEVRPRAATLCVALDHPRVLDVARPRGVALEVGGKLEADVDGRGDVDPLVCFICHSASLPSRGHSVT